MASPLDALSSRQKNICEYGGVFGILITLTCLIQHIAVVIPGKITNPMIPGYIFTMIAFTFLSLQRASSIILLFVSAAIIAFIEYQWMMHFSFSLVVLILFIYHVMIIVGIYTEQIPEALKRKQQIKKEEDDLWKDKI
jgi:hypothetical protein